MSLYFVRADDENGENLDLLVRAPRDNKPEAVKFWRAYYLLEDTDEPEWVGVVPDHQAAYGAIPWDTINPKP